jgi:phospholipid/cholesterol/gamma-HCH transport system permease protein
MVDHLAGVGVASIPIALFILMFTGIVMAIQASYTFTGTIPLYFVGALVGKTIILELGPVLGSLALAGRVGASIAAEIGTMRVTEQIDALETLAYDPVAYLVVPRVLAGIIMFPIVTVFAMLIGIVAGWLTALVMLDMSTPEFAKGLRLFFDSYDVKFALIKATSFGFVVTGIGCFYGFHTTGGAAGVGRATTRAVVLSSMIILVLDAFWAATLL